MINIPISDLKKQIAPLREELDRAIKEVIDNTSFISGSQVSDFEKEVREYCNVKYAVGVSNGTDAIALSLLALGIGPQDAVLCPAFTFYATAGAIASIGALPVFVDIDPLTYNISLPETEKIIKEKRKLRIKAVMPVHLYGQCADMDGILRLAKKYNLRVVEDTAQAFGAEFKGRKAGTIGDCGAVSFFPGKNLGAFGDAGMVMTNEQAVAERLLLLRNQGNKEKYYHLVVGFNHRLDTIQAAVLLVKLRYLDSWNRKRAENAAYFNKGLAGLPLRTPFTADYSTHIYHQYVLRLDSSSAKLIGHLRAQGIDSRVYYPCPLHLQKCFKYLGYKKGDFPESEAAARNTLAIPVYPDLTKTEMDYIISSIKEYFCLK
ncbi:MAG: DegT/DnrJ/EryC1/StrS family aminotransferase [Candidatus Omnitrophota bacterium]|nr:DegT/DnrJ/EryC1/StrS family aminotransferase [Candidatus Omnitrophota bacterium]